MISRSFMALIAAAILLSTTSNSYAHGDEDHGAVAVSSTPIGAKPRIESRTAGLELVAAVDGDNMTIWIDGWADNAPITNADVNVTIDGNSQPAKSASGIYTVSDAKLETAGAHQVAFLITRAGTVESLSAELNVPEVEATTANGGWTYWMVAVGIAVLLIIGFVFWRSRKAGAAVAVAALGLLLLQPRPIQAHGDEDHSAAAPTPTTTIAGGS
jgi:membrane fusion protein, heavy metal efflux system